MTLHIALTGSIGMGKSTVAAMFAKAGIPVFDADAVVRRLQGTGGALVDAIAARFPGGVRDGAVDRPALSALVLGNPEELAALEAIVHPAVQEARAAFIDDHADAPALLFEIPLLYETEGEAAFDKVIVVSAPPDVQRKRVLARGDMSEAKFAAIVARQVPDAEKRAKADFVVDTGTDLSTTERQVGDILACLGLARGR
jgi:dephospho-CoA kinase